MSTQTPENTPLSDSIQHDEFTLDGVRISTTSYLDHPLTADEALQSRLGQDLQPTLNATQSVYVARHNQIMGLTSREAGLNILRVRAFMHRLGAPAKDLRLLNYQAYWAAHYWATGKLASNTDIEATRGLYLPGADVATVYRDPDDEAVAGNEVSEVFVVHELAHGWGSARFVDTPQGPILEQGFAGIDDSSRAFEEGWATLIQGLYTKHELHMATTSVGPLYGRDPKFRKYTYRVQSVESQSAEAMAAPSGAYVAVILERLIEHDPDLFPLLCEGRDDPGKLAEAQQHIDAVRPGLYGELSTLPIYTEKGKTRAMQLNYEVLTLFRSPAERRLARARQLGLMLVTGKRPYIW